MLFLVVSDHFDGSMVGFLFCDGEIRIKDWTYFLWEHWIIITMAWIIVAEATTHRFALQVFLWIQIVDLVDFLLTFNNPWFGITWLSMNTIGMAAFGLAILKEYANERWIKP